MTHAFRSLSQARYELCHAFSNCGARLPPVLLLQDLSAGCHRVSHCHIVILILFSWAYYPVNSRSLGHHFLSTHVFADAVLPAGRWRAQADDDPDTEGDAAVLFGL